MATKTDVSHSERERERVQTSDQERENDLKTFEDLKNRFDLLQNELHNVLDDLQQLHETPHDDEHLRRLSELLSKERNIIRELREVFSSIDELLEHRIKGLIQPLSKRLLR